MLANKLRIGISALVGLAGLYVIYSGYLVFPIVYDVMMSEGETVAKMVTPFSMLFILFGFYCVYSSYIGFRRASRQSIRHIGICSAVIILILIASIPCPTYAPHMVCEAQWLLASLPAYIWFRFIRNILMPTSENKGSMGSAM